MRDRNFASITGASLLAVLALAPFAPASAKTLTLTGNYTISEQYNSSQGGPSVSNVFGTASSSLTGSFSINPGAKYNDFTLSPDGTCSGGGCKGVTETDKITFTLRGLELGSVRVPTITETGVFTAKYSGTELGCAKGDGMSPSSGETDCFVWTGASNTWNGSYMKSVALSNGGTLDVTFTNMTDWNITPKLSVDVLPSVPEPSTWAMMALGFAGLGYAGFRSRRTVVSVV